MQETNKVTDKTKEQLMTANWKDLNLEEKALRSDLERHPKMSWTPLWLYRECHHSKRVEFYFIYLVT